MAPATSDATPVSDMLGPLVKRAHLRLADLTDGALAPFGIDRREFGLLRVLGHRAPVSQQALATDLGVDPTTMVALIDALQLRGFVTREPDPADRRRNAITLTRAGREALEEAAAASAAAEAEFLAPLTEAEAVQFRDALRTVLGARSAPPAAG